MKVYTSWKTLEKLSFEAHIGTWMRTCYRSLDLNQPQMQLIEAKKVHAHLYAYAMHKHMFTTCANDWFNLLYRDCSWS